MHWYNILSDFHVGMHNEHVFDISYLCKTVEMRQFGKTQLVSAKVYKTFYDTMFVIILCGIFLSPGTAALLQTLLQDVFIILFFLLRGRHFLG